MNTLILGGTGMVGQNLQLAFKSKNIEGNFVGSKPYNLIDYKQTQKLFSIYKPEVVIFAAANVGGIAYNKNYPAHLIKDNILMGMNVLDACVEFNIQNLYITSTCCSYPKYCSIPFKEDDLWLGEEDYINSFYGVAKKAIIKASQAYRQQFGLKTTCFILANLYGSFDHFDDLEKSHVIPALIQKFVQAKKQNLPFVELWGAGKVSRDFFYCSDLAETLVDIAISKFDHNQPINLGTGQEVYINELASMIKQLTGYNGKIKLTGAVGDGQPRRCLDVSRAKQLLNWSPKTDLRTGLQNTIDWYIQNNS
jgi:GDP-L-fucose synthase